MAGRRAVCINPATDLTADLAFQRNATRRSLVGPFHAHQLGRQRDGHFNGNARPTHGLGQFARMKIHAIAGATGAAAFADRQT